MQLARHLKTDLLFYFDYSPLQVITNISSHITQPVKRFSHYVMMCLFGQLHIGEKSILTYVFLKGSMSSVKSCGLVYFVKCKLQVLFAIELKKLLWTTKSQLLVQQICLARIIYNVTHNKLMNFEKLLGQSITGSSIRASLCVCRVISTFFYRFKRLFLCFTWSEMSSVSSSHPPPPPFPFPTGGNARETRVTRGLIVHLLACPSNVWTHCSFSMSKIFIPSNSPPVARIFSYDNKIIIWD